MAKQSWPPGQITVSLATLFMGVEGEQRSAVPIALMAGGLQPSLHFLFVENFGSCLFCKGYNTEEEKNELSMTLATNNYLTLTELKFY